MCQVVLPVPRECRVQLRPVPTTNRERARSRYLPGPARLPGSFAQGVKKTRIAAVPST